MALEPCLALQLRSAHARRQPCHAARQRLRTATCTAPCARSLVSVRARRTQKSAGPVGVEAAQRLPSCEASRKARFGMNVTRWREDDRIDEIGDRALCPLAEGCAKLCGIRVCVLSRGSPHSNGDGALLKGILQAVAQVACVVPRAITTGGRKGDVAAALAARASGHAAL